MTTFRKSIVYSMGFTFIFLTTCLYLAWYTWPLKSLSFQEVFQSGEITTSTVKECNNPVHEVGSNENNLYLHKVLNKKVLNDFAMEKKKAFYITPPFEAHGKVTTDSHHAHAVAKNLKKHLEEFTMQRKEAFYITPPFDYETLTPEPDTDLPDESSDTGSRMENNLDQERVEKQDVPQKQASKDKQKKPKAVKEAQDLKDFLPHIANNYNVTYNDTDKVAAKSYDYDITFNPHANQFVTPRIARNQQSDGDQKKIDDMSQKQADIITQLNDLGGDKDKVKSYNKQFEDLMNAIQQQKAWASSTVIIQLDETEVKKKLMGDPFVQRVLKMAQRRKLEYFRKAKEEALKKN